MFVPNAVLAASFVSLAACDSASQVATGPIAPANSLVGQVATNVSHGIRACAASMTTGAPLSGLENRGFGKSPIFERWSIGSFSAPVSVAISNRAGCQTSYNSSPDGQDAALAFAAQVLSSEGYAQGTRTTGNSIKFMNSDGAFTASASFSTQSGFSRITISLKS